MKNGKKQKAHPRRAPLYVWRRYAVLFLILLQAAAFFLLLLFGGSAFSFVLFLLRVLGILLSLRVVSGSAQTGYKLLWVFLLLALPLFSVVGYPLLTAGESRRRWARAMQKRRALRRAPQKAGGAYVVKSKEALQKLLPESATLAAYLFSVGQGAYGTEKLTYLASGEEAYAALLSLLLRARRYIYLEYYIIDEGRVWEEVLAILAKKAGEGVDVRVVMDDAGCMFLRPRQLLFRLSAMGIRAAVFNPVRPVITGQFNHRDHRKIAVVDGEYAITGGVNLADEYINRRSLHGHWRDAALLLEGEAARGMCEMFLDMWEVCQKEGIPSLFHGNAKRKKGTRPTTRKKRKKEQILSSTARQSSSKAFAPLPSDAGRPTAQGQGDDALPSLAVPYASHPFEEEHVCAELVLQLVFAARRYLYLTTPYLIPDDTTLTALSLAAKSGVDVRILVPHHGDRGFVHATTRSYYAPLLEAGVRIYEYTPGFVHAKTAVLDDRLGSVGSANLDYRSLYLNFECGVFFADRSTAVSMREDFLLTLKRSREIRLADTSPRTPLSRLATHMLRLFAPLM